MVAAGVALLWFARRPFRFAVEGESMSPTIHRGDWVLALARMKLRRGVVVVLEHPGRPGVEVVKRLRAVPGDGVGERVLGPDEWWVEGDREDASTDSRSFGPVPRAAIRGRVVAIYHPAGRRRLL